MAAIVGSTEGFHVVSVLPTGATFDTNCHGEEILSEMLKAYLMGWNLRLMFMQIRPGRIS
jgi:hypothetical protein